MNTHECKRGKETLILKPLRLVINIHTGHTFFKREKVFKMYIIEYDSSTRTHHLKTWLRLSAASDAPKGSRPF